MTNGLNPCRFCGGTEKIELTGGELCYRVTCGPCGAEGPIKNTEYEAMAAWNKNPSPQLSRFVQSQNHQLGILIDSKLVISVREQAKGGSVIRLKSEEFFFVAESFDEIEAILKRDRND